MFCFQFNPAVPLKRSDAPTSLADRMHLLVLVVSGKEFDEYPPELISKMKAAMDIAKGQPRGILLIVIKIQDILLSFHAYNCTHTRLLLVITGIKKNSIL